MPIGEISSHFQTCLNSSLCVCNAYCNTVFFLVVSAFRDSTTPNTGRAAVLQPLSYNWGRSADNPCAVGVAVRCEPSRGALATPTLSPACFSTYRKDRKAGNRCFHRCVFSLPSTPETGRQPLCSSVCPTSARNAPHGAAQRLTWGQKKTAGFVPAVFTVIFTFTFRASDCRLAPVPQR